MIPEFFETVEILLRSLPDLTELTDNASFNDF
jgi:hypothetical protein